MRHQYVSEAALFTDPSASFSLYPSVSAQRNSLASVGLSIVCENNSAIASGLHYSSGFVADARGSGVYRPMSR